MASSSRRLHKLLYQHVERSMTSADVKRFINMTVGTYLEAGVVSRCNGDMYELLNSLEAMGEITVGNYNNLMRILLDANLFKLYREVRIKADEINEIIKLSPSSLTQDIPKRMSTLLATGDEHAVLVMAESIEKNGRPTHTPTGSVEAKKVTKETRIYESYKLEELQEKSDSWLKVCKMKQAKFFPTTTHDRVLEIMQGGSSLLVVGNRGEGKSSILQQIALAFSKGGYLILFLKSPKEIEEHFLQNRKLIFIFDDPFGEVFCLRKAEKWVHLGELFFQRLFKSSQIKLLFACSQSVWSECTQLLDKLPVFQNRFTVCTSKLSFEEKVGIVRCHLPATRNLSDETIYAVCSVDTFSFPKSCESLCKAGIQFSDSDFVSHFFSSYGEKQKLLNSLPRTDGGKLSNVMLVSVMLNGGFLPCDVKCLNDKQRLIVRCLSLSNDDQILPSVFSSTENVAGVFLCKTLLNGELHFTFKESSFLEMVLTDFVRKDPIQFKEWCDLSLLSRVFSRRDTGSNDKSIPAIPQDVYAILIEIIANYVSENNYSCIALFADNIQSEIIHFLSSNDNIVYRLIDNDNEYCGNFLYHLIRTQNDRVSLFLCQRKAKSSRFLRFHPLVAMADGGRHIEISKLLDLLENGGSQSCDIKQNFLNNNTTERSQCSVIQESFTRCVQHTDIKFNENNGNFRDNLLICIEDHCDSNLPVVLGHALLQAVVQKQTNVVEILLKYTTLTAKFDLSLTEALCWANDHGQSNHVTDVLLLNLPQQTRDETLLDLARKGVIGLTKLMLETGLFPNGIDLALLEASRGNKEEIIPLLKQYNPAIESTRVATLETKLNGHDGIVRQFSKSLLDEGVKSLIEQPFCLSRQWLSGDLDRFGTEGTPLSLNEANDTIPNQTESDLKRAILMRDTKTLEQIVKCSLPLEETKQCVRGLARTGDTQLLHLLLQDTSPSECFQTAFISASWGGHLDAVMSVSTNRISNETLSKAIREASRRNQLSVVDYLTDLTSDSVALNDALFEAVWMGHLFVIQLILDKLEHILCPKVLKRLLIVSVYQGHYETAKFLLSLNVDPAVISVVLQISADSGHDDFVRQYLSFIPDKCDLGKVVEAAAWQGQISLLEQLQEKEISSKNLVNAIYIASARGLFKVLTVLLKYKSVEDTFFDSFQSVVRSGDKEAVNLMLSMGLPDNVLGKGLLSATITNNREIVRLVLPQIHSPQAKRAALLSAAFRGDIEILKQLAGGVSGDILEDAFLRASWSGKISSVKYLSQSLLQTALMKGINVASVRGHINIVCVLLSKSNLVELKTQVDGVNV